jgi:hypothetical protein
MYSFPNLVLDNYSMELGTQDKKLVLQVAWRERRDFSTVPQEFDIKPQVTHVGKILLLQHSALGVPTKWHTCLVSSGIVGVAQDEKPTKNSLSCGVALLPKIALASSRRRRQTPADVVSSMHLVARSRTRSQTPDWEIFGFSSSHVYHHDHKRESVAPSDLCDLELDARALLIGMQGNFAPHHLQPPELGNKPKHHRLQGRAAREL